MDINLEMIVRILSSDELCDRVNSFSYKNVYIDKISDYVLSLCDSFSSVKSNINIIVRYLKKFVVGCDSKENVFFNKVLLRLYGYNLDDACYIEVLNSFNFYDVKELLIKRYNEIISNKSSVFENELVRMLCFYCYVCPNYVMSIDYINYFTFYLVSRNICLSYDLICYYYKAFCFSFSVSKDVSASFVVMDSVIENDPYYDKNRKKVIIYKQNITDKVDYMVLSDIFYQIKYLYLLNSINNPKSNVYTYDELCLVKELCLISILGDDYFDKLYGDISYSTFLRKQSRYTVKNYFSSIGLNIDLSLDINVLSVSRNLSSSEDCPIDIDVLFDFVLRKENPNLLSELVKNYPILGCQYKRDKRKSLLNLLLDIYSNKKLLSNLNKDLEWHKGKLGFGEDEVIAPKISRLERKISVCSSYINVMSLSINNSNMMSDDIVRSISDLIIYDTRDIMVQNDICSILCNVIPNKIKKLCTDRDVAYRENLKKRIIKCYLDSLSLVRNDFNSEYFMRIYSSLDLCIHSID